MTAEIAFTLIVLAAVIGLFVWDKLGVDVVAILCLLTLTLSGILTPPEALSGFSNSAVVTVAAIFVVSSALLRTGAADRMGDLFLKLGSGSEVRLLIAVMVGAAVVSAFMYNAPATAVLMPAVIVTARRAGLAPSKLLIPLSYGTILGGVTTLIGATPNLVISQSLEAYGLPPFHIFDPFFMGLIFTAAGIAFMALVGRRLLPDRDDIQDSRRTGDPEELVSLFCLTERWHRLRIPDGSKLDGQTPNTACLGCDYGVTVLGLASDKEPYRPLREDELLSVGDVLLVQGHDHDVESLVQDWQLEKLQDQSSEWSLSGLALAEVSLAPRSKLENKSIGEINFRRRYGLEVLGVWRGDRAYRSHLADFKLQIGDALLLRGPCDQVEKLHASADFLILTETPTGVSHPEKAVLSMAILALCLIPVLLGLLSLSIASLSAAVLMVLTGCLQPDEVYQGINWKVVVMLGGVMSLGTAMQKTGAALYIAQNLIEPVAALGHLPLLAILLAVSMLLSITTSNLATGVLMSPLAINVALRLNYSPHALLMAVMIGVSTAFITPFAHQANLIVMGPGNYRFNDYLKVGALLTLVVVIVTLVALPVVWPL